MSQKQTRTTRTTRRGWKERRARDEEGEEEEEGHNLGGSREHVVDEGHLVASEDPASLLSDLSVLKQVPGISQAAPALLPPRRSDQLDNAWASRGGDQHPQLAREEFLLPAR
eukprot:747290-Hanusia_phi.AAC.2